MRGITGPYAWKISVLTAYTITLSYKYKMCTLERFQPIADKVMPVEHFTWPVTSQNHHYTTVIFKYSTYLVVSIRHILSLSFKYHLQH